MGGEMVIFARKHCAGFRKNVISVMQNKTAEFILHRKNDLSEIEINALIEMELIDDNFLESQNAALLINTDKTICILINGLDHIKIQVVGNNDIEGLYEIGNEIDDILEDDEFDLYLKLMITERKYT